MLEHVQRLLHYLSVGTACQAVKVNDPDDEYARWLVNPWDCLPDRVERLLIMRYHPEHANVILMDVLGVTTVLRAFNKNTTLDFSLAPPARLDAIFSNQNSWHVSRHWKTGAWFTEQVNSFSDAWRPTHFFAAALSAL